MQNYKDVLKEEERVWFEIDPETTEEFLTWAKEIGLTWLNGEEIEPQKGANFFHFSVTNQGKLANVPYFVWIAEEFENVKKYYFPEYKKGNLISPKDFFKATKGKIGDTDLK